MSRWAKVAVVAGGYAVAVVAGLAAGWLYDARVSKLPYDTSGGMYAGGEMLSSLAAFLVVALLPTLLALWFLRRNTRFWNVVAIVSVAFAGAGLLAILRPLVSQTSGKNVGDLVLELVRVSHLLGAPVWLAGFTLCAFLAPSRGSRWTLLTATAIEVVIGVCAAVHWFVPRSPW